MNSGIYTITNKVDGKIYVGLAMCFSDRQKDHWKSLKRGKHKNRHLQRAWSVYGEESFVFEVLVECEEEFLCSEEHYWATLLDVHNPDKGYNMRPTHPYGKPTHSEETRKKIGEAGKGRKCPEHVRIANKNRRHTDEVKEKIRLAGIGRFCSEERKRKISESNMGKPKSFRGEVRDRLFTEEEKKQRARESVKRYEATDRAKELRKISKKLWKLANPEKVKEQQRKQDKKKKEKKELEKHLSATKNQRL